MGKTKFKSLLLLTAFIVIENCDTISDAGIYSGQPRILVQNGNLVLEAAQGKNITFKTNGQGMLNILGGDTGEEQGGGNAFIAGGVAGQQEVRDRLERLEDTVNSGIGLESRLREMNERIEQLMANDNSANYSVLVSQVRRNSAMIRRLSRILSRMRRNRRNECTSNPCRHGGTCVDTYSSFVCLCPENWSGNTCEEDVNECSAFAGTDLGCKNGAQCQNTPGSYLCHCQPGFFGVHCADKSNTCAAGGQMETCGHGRCVDTTQGITCICDQGWTTGPGGPACVIDVDECAAPNPPCSTSPMVQCINTMGAFTCGSCPAGYSGNGFYCSDVDECLVGNGGCSLSPRVDCFNTLGSRSCGTCPAGYVGDGTSCTFLGPCHVNNGGCSPTAVCAQISGTVQCLCTRGYTGTGVGPFGCMPDTSSSGNLLPQPPDSGTGVVLSPCASGPCQNGATCYPLATSFMCNCAPGYTGNMCQSEIDECASNPCLNGGTCVNQFGRYTCQCANNYEGQNCQTESQQCGGNFDGATGSIRYPLMPAQDYNANMDCIYLIRVPYDKVINITFTQFNLEQSSTCSFDWIQIYNGPDLHSPPMGTRMCGHDLPGDNGTVVTSHHVARIHFVSDHSVNHLGFALNWQAVDPVCGGESTPGQTHGTLRSPGHPARYPHNRDCTWTVRADLGKRVQFHFATLRIETHSNCSYDYVEVWDGTYEDTTKHLLGRYCNTTSPPPVTSSGSIASVVFHSDGSASDEGFVITWAQVQGIPGCGGLFTEPTAELRSPRHPETYHDNLNCEYLIRMPVGDRIKITFISFEVEHHTRCNFDYLELRDGARSDSPLVGRYCGAELPPVFASSTNQVYLKFYTDWSVSHGGFRLRYEVVCGGEYTEPTGYISSPYFPGAYPRNRECAYVISQPPGTRIHIEFMQFDVESHSDCMWDFLEIRDGDNENSTLIGKFCGDPTSIPAPIDSQHNYLWMRFRTDGSVQNRGFKLNYTTSPALCGGILRSNFGVINSPTDTEHYPDNAECTWIISGAAGSIVRLTWITFALESCGGCSCDSVSVYDNSSVPNSGGLIGKFCGTDTPPMMTSTSNRMSVVFKTDYSVGHDGFTATYVLLDADSFCGGNYFTTEGVLHSPGWPNNYGHGRECIWKIKVPPGQQIMLNFTTFQMENHPDCNYDYLEIRNGGQETSPLVGKFCGDRIPRTVPSFTNELFIKFVSDSTLDAPGFELYWDGTATGCGGLLTSAEGSLTSPGYPSPYHHAAECIWEIRVSRGSNIRFVFVDLDLESSSECNYDYVELLDGPTVEGSDSLGKYCHSGDSGVPMGVSSTSSDVTLRFRSDHSVAGRGFHIRYFTICNTVINARRQHNGVIESPNFPNPYPHNRNCTWTLVAPEGNKFNLTFSHFDVEEARNRNGTCLFDFVDIKEEVMYGSNTTLGHFCGYSNPPRVSSNQRRVHINFVSDASVAPNGFRLEWVINGCGGDLFGKSDGVISTPGYPAVYPLNVECIWRIRTPLGTSVQLNVTDFDFEQSRSCVYDGLIVYAGPDITSPNITHLCHRSQDPVIATASGNEMTVRFYSDVTVRGRGFIASYAAVPGGCGGLMTAPSGVISSPNYPNMYGDHDDCGWTIRVPENHVVNLRFEDFDVEPHSNCSYDYVALYDGESSDSPLIVLHCGSELPDPVSYSSTGNTMHVRLKADGSVPAKGFKASYQWGCGARIVTNGTGELTSPNYPHIWETGGNCSWIITGGTTTDRVTLTLSHVDIHYWDQTAQGGSNCSRFFLEVLDGVGEDAPSMGRFCSRDIPPSLVSTGNSMHVKLVRPYGTYAGSGFRATYTVEDSACGGDLYSNSGRFTSPSYPSSYPQSAQCIWTIGGAPGNRVQLSFLSFDVESSTNCNSDYVEVHEGSAEGPLVGHYCGDEVPDNITAANSFWIKFNSDGEGTAPGFVAQYNLLHGNELSGSSGEIASPFFPHMFFNNYRSNSEREVTWRVIAQEGMGIAIQFLNFELEPNNYGGCLDTLYIYNGYEDSAPLLYSGCGMANPSPLAATNNVIFIKMQAGYYQNEGLRFKLSWNAIPMSEAIMRNSTSTSSSAAATSSTVIQVPTNRSVPITNPGYPGYEDNLNAEWLLESPPGTRIRINIAYLSLESTYRCRADYVEILDGLRGTQEWNSTGRYCRRQHRGTVVISQGSVAKIKFVTDASVQRQGFRIYAKAVCGGYVTSRRGTVASAFGGATNYARNADCAWIVEARPGRTIGFRFDLVNIRSNDAQCQQDYITVRNGPSQDSPFILLNPEQGEHQNGRLCRSSIPPPKNTSSNYLRVELKANGDSDVGLGFSMRFRENGLGCGGEVQLLPGATDLSEYELSSPNYPRSPMAHAECIWRVTAPPGQRIQVDFLEQFYIHSSDRCANEGVELREGATEHSTLMDRFCGDKPSTQTTQGNALYFRYYSNLDNPNIGFKAKVKIATCGGTHYVGMKSTIQIESPNHPGSYGNNLDCSWKIVGPAGHYLRFEFVEMDLPYSYNCSTVDHVYIQEANITANSLDDHLTQLIHRVAEHGVTNPVSGPYCGDGINAPYGEESNATNVVADSFGNEAFLVFKTDGYDQGKTGFIVRINASVDGCGGLIEGSSGILKSPGYPTGYPHHHYCKWVIRGPEFRSVKLEFTDFDLEPGTVYTRRDNTTATYCRYDYVFLVSGNLDSPAYLSTPIPMPYPGTRCGSQLPPIVSSTTNEMTVLLRTDGTVSHRGFYARWSTEEPTVCGGPLSGQTGVISPPMTGVNYSANSLCQWKLTGLGQLDQDQQEGGLSSLQKTAVFKAPQVFMERGSSRGCSFDSFRVFAGNAADDEEVASVCDRHTTPVLIASPGASARIVFKSDSSISDRGFNFTYSYSNCGGLITGPGPVTITSPGGSSNYPNNIDCAWNLKFDEGSRVRVTFSRFNLEQSDNCAKDYVAIHNGPYPTSPTIWRGCGSNMPDHNPIVSESNHLWISFHSDDTGSSSGFAFTVAQESLGCGGILHWPVGNITSPSETGVVGGKYPNGVECTWILNADAGFHAVLQFYGRFDVEAVTGCTNDFLEVSEYSQANGRFVRVGDRLCGRELPAEVSTGSERSKLMFRSNGQVNGDGFRIRYRMECGETFNDSTSSTGQFASPGYPVAYSNGLKCNYTIVASPQDFVSLTFAEPFELENNYRCNYDSITITEVATNTQKGKFCGSDPPPPISTRGTMLIQFRTDRSVVKNGFRANFEIHSCGGNVTEEGEIKSPVHPNDYFHNTNCTWIITAPEGMVVEIKFQRLNLENQRSCRFDHVAAFDGDSVVNASAEIGKYCGAHGVPPPVLKSRGNRMAVQFKTDGSVSATGFSALIRFTYGPSRGCGGVINLRPRPINQGVTLRSLDADNDGNYEPDLNCQWLVAARQGKVIRMTFTGPQFDLEKTQNETDTACWDYVEIRDGDGPYAPLVGRYCGQTSPQRIDSTSNFLWIKFFSDSDNNRVGFTASVAQIEPVCGSNEVINVTEANQLLVSPNFPDNYPSNLRCRWILTAGTASRWDKIHIHFVDLSMQDSQGCSSDYIRLEDENNRLPVSHGGENGSLVVSGGSNYYFNARWRRTLLHQTVDHCGTQRPPDFYSMGSTVLITFATDAQTASRGFKLQYSIASCNRTYSSDYGRILSPSWPHRARPPINCQFTIQAAEGKRVSIYFGSFGISSSTNCTRGYLELRDGSSNTSPILGKLCGYSVPSTVHASGNVVTATYVLQERRYARGYDLSFTAAEQVGCGGTLYDTRGVVTSPGFPANHSSSSDCTWTLKVPQGQRIELKFTSLTFGSQDTCSTDFIELYSVRDDTRQLMTRYCGDDNPADYLGPTNTLQLRYVTSENNGGSWRAQFQIAIMQGVSGTSPQSGLSHT